MYLYTEDWKTSMAEMKADISNPKYHKDEAFRNKVLVKIQASKAAGTIRL